MNSCNVSWISNEDAKNFLVGARNTIDLIHGEFIELGVTMETFKFFMERFYYHFVNTVVNDLMEFSNPELQYINFMGGDIDLVDGFIGQIREKAIFEIGELNTDDQVKYICSSLSLMVMEKENTFFSYYDPNRSLYIIGVYNEIAFKLTDYQKNIIAEKFRSSDYVANALTLYCRDKLLSPKRRKFGKNFSEKSLETIIINNLHKLEHGMQFIQRQVKLKHGVIDIITQDKNGTKCIIELKIVDDCKLLAWQASYYQSEFAEEVRVIVIAPDYRDDIYSSLSNIKNVEMKTYYFSEQEIFIEDYKPVQQSFVSA